MEQEAFNAMLKKALQEKITFNVVAIADIYGANPDQNTVQVLFDGEVINQFVIFPLQAY